MSVCDRVIYANLCPKLSDRKIIRACISSYVLFSIKKRNSTVDSLELTTNPFISQILLLERDINTVIYAIYFIGIVRTQNIVMSDSEQEPNATIEQPKRNDENKHKQVLIELNRRKRANKRDTTKARHHLEKLIWKARSTEDGVNELEHGMETLWEILEETQSNMDQLSAHHVEQKDFESQKLILQESKELEEECQKVIEMAQSEILKSVATSTAVRPSTGKVDVADKD